ncbi:hypothetical protein GGR54DRAFT_525612 [Hypoxylon sp. NC1633]|nr:hypothetical protein GGR54DRAFT_525612 [Hypoxylon sp. NC1633]
MDPLSALALAGNVLQFIEFTTGLLSKTIEVYKSATGASSASLALEEICRQLSAFGDSLHAGEGNSYGSASETALRGVADLCSADCARLLTVLTNLRVKDGNHRAWKSFRAALKLAWKGEQEIETLISRLRDRQSMMTLHICAISNEWLRDVNKQLRNLEEQNKVLQLQQLDRMNEISSHIQDIRLKVNNSTTTGPDYAFSAAEIHNLTTKLSYVSVTERDIAKEQAILSSLDYQSRSNRREDIKEAHARTFGWMFESSDQKETSGRHLVKWLRESSGVFWISGKPGSGKSTFMKFLANHTKTRDALQLWAAPRKVVIASHFFWSSGVSMQKSVKGLFQSLLYDIFRQCPELIGEACPFRWVVESSEAPQQDWTFKELVECFRAIKDDEMSTVRFCFFIDGLDEFDGDYTEISQTLTEIAASPRIKLCVASRPLNEFWDQFGTNTSFILSIHELTWNDIIGYARSRLQEHPRWLALGLDVLAARSFLEKIAELAHGVFLWVTLVTQSLRDGLANDDTMEDLNARLDSLPKSLEAFYKQMLDSVDPIYHRRSANLLQMHIANSQVPGVQLPMPWAMALFCEREDADPNYAVTMPRTTLTRDDVQSLRRRTSRRLNAMCRGILEMRSANLVFIHRTASDFLRTTEMVAYIRTRSGEGYNPLLSLLRGCVACLKMRVFGTGTPKYPVQERDINWRHAVIFAAPLWYAEEVKRNGIEDAVVFELVDCLEDISMSLVHPQNGSDLLEELDAWSTPLGYLYTPLHFSPFVTALLRTYAADFAAVKLSTDGNYFRRLRQPALWLLMVDTLDPWRPDSLKLLHLLLKNTHDPNESFLDMPAKYMPTSIIPGLLVWGNEFDGSPDIEYSWEGGGSQTQASPVLRSTWSEFLCANGISACFGPRRRIECKLHHYTSTYSIPRFASPKDIFSRKYINSGLEHGVFSLLLQHGADPNAHASPFTTAWVDFVCLPIRYPLMITATSQYLETVDAFFNCGADLGASAIGLTLLPGDTTGRLPFCMITGWDFFCEALEDLTMSRMVTDLKFIAQITTKMIKQAIAVQWPLGKLPSIIVKVFPKELLRPMLDIIAENQTGRESLEARGKRSLEGVSGVEGEGKRLKPHFVHASLLQTP